ncbi:MAG: ribbon-helix-helix protein, CopG family [Candidatus Omnitrophota bacterium]
MRQSVSISLPKAVVKQLKYQCKVERASSSEIVREALREHFFRTEFSRLRRKAMLEAARKGIHLSEEDIFKKVS